MDGGLSPPPSKRRKLSTSAETSPSVFGNDLTLYSWNVNGIAPFIQPAITSFFRSKGGKDPKQNVTKASLRDFLRRHHWPMMVFLQEVKINPDDSATLHAVERAVKRQGNEPSDSPEYEAHFCLPSDKYNARSFGRKVYGVCSIVRKDYKDRFVKQIRPVSWDVEGRFLVIETKAIADMPKLAIFNIYAVNGTEHPYRDSNTGRETGTRHDRKLRVHALLQAECRALEADGFGIILAGDMNIARTTKDGHPNLRTFPNQHRLNRADFEPRFFSDQAGQDLKADRTGLEKDDRPKDAGLGMIDTFRHLHPDKKCYTYYPRTKSFGENCDRVDMIIISECLRDHLREAGMYETPSERGSSDHVPLYAKFNFEEGRSGDQG